MNLSLPIAAAVALIAIAGCASVPPKVILPLYDDAAYQPYTALGTATVSGASYLVTKGGDVKKGTSRIVLLIPRTPFLLARMDPYYIDSYSTFETIGFGGEKPENITKAWLYTKTAVSDIDGKFTFTKVPAGQYIVETQLVWQSLRCGFFGCGLGSTGAVLRKQIEVIDGAVIDVQLTSPIPL